MEVAVFADDLTGALEVGALLAREGIPAPVLFQPGRTAPAAVFDTETRELEPGAAAGRLAEFAVPARFVYKKTDSLLRGNIAAELAALAARYPGRAVAYAPAYPALGRTVRKGVLYVNGKALGSVPQAAAVFDSESEEDLAAVASGLDPAGVIAAGPAGLARYWIRRLPVARPGAPPRPPLGRALVVCGSLHPESRRLAAEARRAGLPVIATPGTAERVPFSIGHRVADYLRASTVDTLVVFGGATARSIVAALGVQRIEPCDEAAPGVPVSAVNWRNRRLALLTKAGAFPFPSLLSLLGGNQT